MSTNLFVGLVNVLRPAAKNFLVSLLRTIQYHISSLQWARLFKLLRDSISCQSVSFVSLYLNVYGVTA